MSNLWGKYPNTMRAFKIALKVFVVLLLLGAIAGGIGAAVIYNHLKAKVPDPAGLRDIQFQTPLRIYSADEKLIAEYGEKRRTPINYEQIPQHFINAILAAEDRSFFEHDGVDYMGLMRAVKQLVESGRIRSGGSTITMQVARNFYLSREQKFERKFIEILLSWDIEKAYSKQEILELYVNKIYLGYRAYGIQAAAQVYYGKDISELSLAQLAMIAGLPKAPSTSNPISNPERAKERRNWILRSMHQLAFITDQEYETARNEPVTAYYHTADIELDAPYIAEMVRSDLYATYGDDLYTEGFRAYTTIRSDQQATANQALKDGLLAYSERHGYRGPEKQLGILSQDAWQEALDGESTIGEIEPAIVTEVLDQSIKALRKGGEIITLNWDDINSARTYIDANKMGPKPESAADIVAIGDLIRVRVVFPETDAEDALPTWRLTQIPEVQGALVALDPNNGAVTSLVGGFDFYQNKFNRVTQASRQAGSNIKPFIYTTALANGFSPSSLINDAPVVFHDNNLESSWRPENYSKKFYGPTRLREALYKSRNLVSIRLLKQLGIKNTINYLGNFGFEASRLPANLSLSLGSADLTPMEVVRGYATLANGGYLVEPYYLTKLESDVQGEIFVAKPATVCPDCVYIDESSTTSLTETQQGPISPYPLAPQTLEPRVAYLIENMMQDVITRGTGKRALALGRTDLAGKTGTTNDQVDAWFSGFNSQQVASVWVGFDNPATLGRNEFGGSAALPIWVDFMRTALKDVPDQHRELPPGIVNVRIDPKTGKLAYPGQSNALFDLYLEELAPTEMSQAPEQKIRSSATEDLF
ncbi:MAG: penicillin-binding protein 1A [Pontibacterium sp.]